MKKQVSQLFTSALLLTALIFNFGCEEEKGTVVDNSPIPSPGLPLVKTIQPSDFGFSALTAVGEVTNDGGAPILSYGLCWGTAVNPTIELGTKTRKDTIRSGAFEFEHSFILTIPQTRYFLRSYALNKAGISYGNSFTTVTKPINVSDRSGFTYSTIAYRDQVWTRENLRVLNYNNNLAINYIRNEPIKWTNDKIGAFCLYNNVLLGGSSAIPPIFGSLYNHFAVVNSGGLCPKGWHVPTIEEWTILINLSGGISNAGFELKGQTLNFNAIPPEYVNRWKTPVTITGNFGANPGGFRQVNATFKGLLPGNLISEGGYWTSSLVPGKDSSAYSIGFKDNDPTIYIQETDKRTGLSVRCLWDGNPK